MITKLTLKIDDKVLDSTKKYARRKGESLSDIVENYLKSISNREVIMEDLSPKVARLKGVIKLPEDFDYKREIRSAMVKKYR